MLTCNLLSCFLYLPPIPLTRQQGHRGSLPVLMDHFDPGNPRSELRVDFEGCSFTGNDANGGPAVTAVTAGQTRPRAPQPAVIASRGGQNRLVVDRCLFEGNDYVTNNTMVSSTPQRAATATKDNEPRTRGGGSAPESKGGKIAPHV